jgi:hypothetical protein
MHYLIISSSLRNLVKFKKIIILIEIGQAGPERKGGIYVW